MSESKRELEIKKLEYYRYYYEKGYLKEDVFKEVENQIIADPNVCPKLIAEKPLSKKTYTVAIAIGCSLWGFISAFLKSFKIFLGVIPAGIVIWLCMYFGKKIFQGKVELQYYDNWKENKSDFKYVPKSRSIGIDLEKEKDLKSSGLCRCEMCDTETEVLSETKIVDSMGTRYRKLCPNCISKYNVSIIELENTKSENFNEGKSTESIIDKSTHCHKCGAKIIEDSAFCSKCGAKVKMKKSKNKKAINIVMLVLLCISFVANVALAVICATNLHNYKELKDKYFSLQCDNSLLESHYKSMKSSFEKSEVLRKAAESYEEEAAFFDSYAVIVYDSDEKHYHKYGCSYCDADGLFWIYNTELAKSYGIKPCSHCF